jgi:hypothetical protein
MEFKYTNKRPVITPCQIDKNLLHSAFQSSTSSDVHLDIQGEPLPPPRARGKIGVTKSWLDDYTT